MKKSNKKLEKQSRAYFDVSGFVGLKDDMSLNEKVDLLIKASVKELENLHKEEDSIIEQDYDTVFNILNIPISKQQYKEFVTIMTKIRVDGFSDKNREKYEENVKQKMFDSCIREQFLDKVVNSFDDEIPVPDFNKNISINVVSNDDKEFNNILNTSIERNLKINNVHKKVINDCGLAFEYITEGKYSSKDFKTLVDWKYYTGGIPNDNSKSKLFDLFYRYMKAFRLGLDFNLKEFQPLLREMGMEVILFEPLPNSDHYEWWDREVVERYCPTALDDFKDWMTENK